MIMLSHFCIIRGKVISKSSGYMKQRKSQESGFTIIELMLALAFLSVMLIFVLSATIQVMRSYNKGLVMKQMNQTGRTITEDITRSARSAWASDTSSSIDISKVSQGRLCVGGVSYVWNEPEIVDETGIDIVSGADNKFDNGDQVDIVRIVDKNGQFCSDPTRVVMKNDDNTSILSGSSVRIAGMSAHSSVDSKLISFKFYVGSSAGDKLIKSGDHHYQCPTGASSLYGTFCAIADFETTAYLRNKNGG